MTHHGIKKFNVRAIKNEKNFKIFEKLEEFLIVNDAAIRIVIIIFYFFV